MTTPRTSTPTPTLSELETIVKTNLDELEKYPIVDTSRPDADEKDYLKKAMSDLEKVLLKEMMEEEGHFDEDEDEEELDEDEKFLVSLIPESIRIPSTSTPPRTRTPSPILSTTPPRTRIPSRIPSTTHPRTRTPSPILSTTPPRTPSPLRSCSCTHTHIPFIKPKKPIVYEEAEEDDYLSDVTDMDEKERVGKEEMEIAPMWKNKYVLPEKKELTWMEECQLKQREKQATKMQNLRDKKTGVLKKGTLHSLLDFPMKIDPPRPMSSRLGSVCNMTEPISVNPGDEWYYVTFSKSSDKTMKAYLTHNGVHLVTVGPCAGRYGQIFSHPAYYASMTCPEEWDSHYADGLLPFDPICQKCMLTRNISADATGVITHVFCDHCGNNVTRSSEFAI